MVRDLWKPVAAALAVSVACSDPSTGPAAVPVRDALFLRLDVAALYLIRTDGSHARRVTPVGQTTGTPIAVTADGTTAAVWEGNVISLASLENLADRHVILASVPSAIGPGAFSPDANLLAIPCVLVTGPAVVVYDRSAQAWDTIPVANPGIFGAPAFSPDGRSLAGLGLTDLAFSLIQVDLPSRVATVQRIGDSRLLNAPLFGWPRWTARDGFVFAARRGLATPDGDTLEVAAVDPAHPGNLLRELWSVPMALSDTADVVFASYSTYSLAEDAGLIMLAAQPDSTGRRHALYAVGRGEATIRPILNSPPQFPLYPQLLR